jgi:hypothetical protein
MLDWLDAKNVLERAATVFFMSFLGYLLSVGVTDLNFDKVEGALIVAGAALLSFVKNVYRQYKNRGGM